MKRKAEKAEAPIEKLVFNMREACRALGVSRPTIYSLMEQGQLKSISFSAKKKQSKRRHYFTPDALKNCIERRQQAA